LIGYVFNAKEITMIDENIEDTCQKWLLKAEFDEDQFNSSVFLSEKKKWRI